MLFRVSVPPRTDAERQAIEEGRQAVVPEPTYGGQLQGFAIQGHAPEARVRITYEDRAGGAPRRRARAPAASRAIRSMDLGYGPMRPDAMLSPRVAAPMIGLGLLEMVDEADILARADPDDRDGDGISGRPNLVWSMENGRPMLGRFGWKAARATISDQTAGAFSGDMGLSTELLPDGGGRCTAAQRSAAARRTGRTSHTASRSRRRCSTWWSSTRATSRSRAAVAPTLPRCCAGSRSSTGAGAGLPHPEVPDARGSRAARAEPAAHLALHGSLAPRHGRGAGRRPAGGPGHRPGVADAAALGHRPHGRRQRPHAFPARRPRAESPRGGALARRRGRGREAARRPDDARRSARRCWRSSGRSRIDARDGTPDVVAPVRAPSWLVSVLSALLAGRVPAPTRSGSRRTGDSTRVVRRAPRGAALRAARRRDRRLEAAARHYCEAPGDRVARRACGPRIMEAADAWQGVEHVQAGRSSHASAAPRTDRVLARSAERHRTPARGAPGRPRCRDLTAEGFGGPARPSRGFPAVEHLLFDPGALAAFRRVVTMRAVAARSS